MKRLSIRARVTLWYTGLLLLVLALGVSYLFAFSEQLTNRQLRDALMDSVSETVQAAHFEYGELEDEDIDFYRNGVSIFLYDTNGRLLAPKVNRGIQVDALLEDQVVKTVTGSGERWMIHDLYAEQDGTGFWVRGMISLSGTQGTLQKMLLVALIGVPGFVLIAALGGWRITRRAFAPVGAMAETADAITSGNDLSRRVPDDGSGDELSRLGRTVNSMLERLQASFEHERRFSSDVSHELRTPTAVIISQCEYALSKESGEGEREQALSAILRQAHRMSAMIGQLLMLARAENGRFQPNWSRLNLSELCEMVALEMADQAQQRDIILTTSLEPDIVLIGDETLLIRMVTNLLTNAITYNRPEGKIAFGLHRTGKQACIEVRDTGIGIGREDLDHIWDRFYRADTARSGEGTGLGLSMVKWIAELHGGSVRAESTRGVGSRFEAVLPLDRNPSPNVLSEES